MLHLGLGDQRKNSPFFTICMVHLKCFNPWNHKRQNCKWLKVIKSFWTYIIWLTFWKVSSIKKIQFVVDIKPYLQISSTSIFNAPHSTKHRDFLPAVDLSSWTLHAKLLDIQPHQIWRTLFFTRFFCQSNRIPLNWIGKMYILYIYMYNMLAPPRGVPYIYNQIIHVHILYIIIYSICLFRTKTLWASLRPTPTLAIKGWSEKPCLGEFQLRIQKKHFWGWDFQLIYIYCQAPL